MTDDESPPSLALHGGAGASHERDYSAEVEHMRGLVEAGRDRLQAGSSALDVVTETICELEACGMYIAGRGASPNSAGAFELDASVMDGSTRRAGAVAALEGYASPILVARQVMERTPHVMLVGDGAGQFARHQRMTQVSNPNNWFTRAGSDEDNALPPALTPGTVGCVARDKRGRLSAGTSTGGVFGKLPGRCGDTALVGAGCWADDTVAVSCTGLGEYFIRVAAAVQVAHRIRWRGDALEQAAKATLAEIAVLGGRGGIIAIDARGEVSMPFFASGMKRAALLPDGRILSAAF